MATPRSSPEKRRRACGSAASMVSILWATVQSAVRGRPEPDPLPWTLPHPPTSVESTPAGGPTVFRSRSFWHPSPPATASSASSARGGMATVYLVQDLRHDRPVALKLMHPELAATVAPRRFLREIQLAARLDHPHILPVYDSGEDAGRLWYVMPYVEGGSLRDRLRREVRLPVRTRCGSPGQIADALEYAHAPRRDPPRHQAGEHPPGAGTRPARRLRHRPRGRGLGRGADSGRHSRSAPPSTWRRSRPAASRWISGATSTRSRACSTRCSRATRPYTGPTAQVIIVRSTLGPPPPVRAAPARGARGARGADHPQPLRRALRPVTLRVGVRRGAGGEPDRRRPRRRIRRSPSPRTSARWSAAATPIAAAPGAKPTPGSPPPTGRLRSGPRTWSGSRSPAPCSAATPRAPRCLARAYQGYRRSRGSRSGRARGLLAGPRPDGAGRRGAGQWLDRESAAAVRRGAGSTARGRDSCSFPMPGARWPKATTRPLCRSSTVSSRSASAFMTRTWSPSPAWPRAEPCSAPARCKEGLALLDEAMVAVTTDEVTPIVAGGVYCSVVSGCQEVFDWRRAQEWTAAMSRWAAPQTDLVLFRGQCLLRRSEVLQLRGDWDGALEEARRALARLLDPPGQLSLGNAYFQLAELHRLRGETVGGGGGLPAGEPAREADSARPGAASDGAGRSRRGVGLAAPDVGRVARVALPADAHRRVRGGRDRRGRSRRGRQRCRGVGRPSLPRPARPISARSRPGRPARYAWPRAMLARALAELRGSEGIWRELDAPYEAARTRVLVGASLRRAGGRVRGGDGSRRSGGGLRALGAAPDLLTVERLRRTAAVAAPP